MTEPTGNANREQTPEQLVQRIRWDERGLVPVVVQDAVSKDVLMMAYMNEAALRKTFETGEAWFWSRSRGELWHKGATSGNTQRVCFIRCDCDGDTLLLGVVPNGPACHTGNYSCFADEAFTGESGAADGGAGRAASAGDRFRMLAVLESIIAKRDAERPEGAYTTYLFEKGIDKILKKVGEETAEVIIAAKNRDNDELRYETSDLLFHLLVLLREARLPLDEVMKELERRHIKS